MSDEQLNTADQDLPCHVCTSLLPLLRKVNAEISAAESRQSQVQNEEGLRYDVDKVFDSLYTSISERESELLRLIEERCGNGKPDEELSSLLEHLEHVQNYCQKTLVYTTKPELLHLTGMIQSRAEELLTHEPTEDLRPVQDIVINEEGLEDLLSQIEDFGKVFNIADVDTAVKEKSFPKEQTGLDEDILTKILSLSSKAEGNDHEDEEDSPLLSQDNPPSQKLSLAAMLEGHSGNSIPGNKEDFPESKTNNYASTGGITKNESNSENGRDEKDDCVSGGSEREETNTDEIVPQVASQQKSMRPGGNMKNTHNGDPRSNGLTEDHREAGVSWSSGRNGADSSDDIVPEVASQQESVRADELTDGKDGGQDFNNGHQSQDSPNSDNVPSFSENENGTQRDNGGVVSLSDMLGGNIPCGVSPLAMFINQRYDEEANEPATYETMKYSLELEHDSQQDGVLTIFPKMGVVEHTIKCAYMEFDKTTVYKENTVTREGKLVNEPPILPNPNTSWRFNNYKGALSTRPLDNTGLSYLEFWTDIEIKQAHGGRSLIFEAAVADRNAIDLYHKAEEQDNAWGLSLSNCPTHGGLCRRTWAAGKALEHFPNTLPNEAKTKAQLRFGFLFCKKKSKLVIIDCTEERVLLVAENVRLARPLWPVFGVYNTELSHVETKLVSSTDLRLEKSLVWIIFQNI